MLKYLTTVATASGDTVKTKVGTITLPTWVKRIVECAVSVGGAGFTTLEIVSGIITLESQSSPALNQEIPFNVGGLVTSGGIPAPVNKFPLDVPVQGNSDVDCYVTMDMALTVNNTIRVSLVVSDA